jgi:hypothetical protein
MTSDTVFNTLSWYIGDAPEGGASCAAADDIRNHAEIEHRPRVYVDDISVFLVELGYTLSCLCAKKIKGDLWADKWLLSQSA